MLANDIKKGMRVRLKNGWYGTMYDNKKGNIRMCEVEGIETEIGSVYTHEIGWVQTEKDAAGSIWEPVTLSDRQAKNADSIKSNMTALFGDE